MLTTAANLCRFRPLPRAVTLSPAGQSVRALFIGPDSNVAEGQLAVHPIKLAPVGPRAGYHVLGAGIADEAFFGEFRSYLMHTVSS